MKNIPEKEAFYFDLKRGEFLRLGEPDLMLAQAQGKLVKVPAAMMLVAAPVFSLAYVIFLPFAGIMAILAYTGYRLRGLLRTGAAQKAPAATRPRH
ncbi:MAG: hypothetical protein HYX96_08315 [Chloroflexi bacterium]|nr:hypothetical protein [Chloroflexota bacterium]